MAHADRGVLATTRDASEPVLTRWMDIEPVIQWSKSERENKHRILMHVCGIQKDGPDEPIYRAAVEMQT